MNYFFLFLLIPFNLFAQYPSVIGQEGNIAVSSTSSTINFWVNNPIQLKSTIGWMNIADTTLGKANYGENSDVLGEADGSVLSLGDGGSVIIQLQETFGNVDGYDFAIFENSFSDDFLELAFVEVSSNGTDFYRFPAISLTDTVEQIGPFDVSETERINNLAGKYPVFYGTPFNLDDLPNINSLNKQAISHLKIIDVVGSLNTDFCSYDSQGNKINDPWPTAFESSGFDLDAIAILHPNTIQIEENLEAEFSFEDNILTFVKKQPHFKILDFSGRIIKNSRNRKEINLNSFKSGIYIVQLKERNFKIFVQ